LILRRGVRHSNETLESYRYGSALINLSSHF